MADDLLHDGRRSCQYPFTAEHGGVWPGFGFLYIIPALLFFIPVSLVASELGTGWNGGIYGWVRQAYGDRPGFFIMWFMWIQVVVWYPIVLGFGASTMAYLINPELAKSGVLPPR